MTSPEAILILPIAVVLDLVGFIIFCLGTWVGIDDYGILEIIGGAIIGLWMILRGSGSSVGQQKSAEPQEKPVPPKKELSTDKNTLAPKAKTLQAKDLVKNPKEFAKKTFKTFIWNYIVELIPFVGGFWPGWTIIVYKTLD